MRSPPPQFLNRQESLFNNLNKFRRFHYINYYIKFRQIILLNELKFAGITISRILKLLFFQPLTLSVLLSSLVGYQPEIYTIKLI